MDSFFQLKPVVGMLAQPLPAVFLLAFFGALLLLARRKRMAARFLLLSFLVLFLASFPPLVRLQAKLLEHRHKPLLPDRAKSLSPWAIVVLGNGVAHPGDAGMPALTRLNDAARARLVEGVRLAGLFPEARLVTTGYGMGLENCADAMAEAAAELGVDAERILRLPQSVDTGNEAGLVADLAKGRDLVLVTSAAHMPRAAAEFQALNLRVTASPCDYIAPLADDSMAAVNRARWRPRGGSLADSEELWHEYLGLAYQWYSEWRRESL